MCFNVYAIYRVIFLDIKYHFLLNGRWVAVCFYSKKKCILLWKTMVSPRKELKIECNSRKKFSYLRRLISQRSDCGVDWSGGLLSIYLSKIPLKNTFISMVLYKITLYFARKSSLLDVSSTSSSCIQSQPTNKILIWALHCHVMTFHQSWVCFGLPILILPLHSLSL